MSDDAEVTPEMIERGALADPLSCDVDESEKAIIYANIYRAMHAARPKSKLGDLVQIAAKLDSRTLDQLIKEAERMSDFY